MLLQPEVVELEADDESWRHADGPPTGGAMGVLVGVTGAVKVTVVTGQGAATVCMKIEGNLLRG